MQPSRTSITQTPGKLEQGITLLILAACAGFLAYKFYVAWRINVNWDEFWFLSFVHTLLRGETTPVLQGAYTHLFTWLPRVGSNEVDQVVAARIVMLAFLGLTAGLIWRLASCWFDGLAAAAAPFAYLTMIPVMTHGGSFRADSMLAPLLMGATLLLAAPGRSRNRELLAGAALGLAAAVTVKILLFGPMLLLLILVVGRAGEAQGGDNSASRLRSILIVGTAALVVAGVAIAAHAAAISGSNHAMPSALQSESLIGFATRTATTTVLEAGPFPRGNLILIYAKWQPLPWLLIAVGLIAAAFRRRVELLALALSLLPIVFYRNAYPYFYVVMLAPASVLVAYSIDMVSRYVGSKGPVIARQALAVVLALGIVYQGLMPAAWLLEDRQSIQRTIVAGVHQIFPEPENYIDRCGMISSFRKANFFMSTWGMASYRAAGKPVMQTLASEAKPAFVIMNVGALATVKPSSRGLLEPDRDFLQRNYSRYWGPIKVAGGTGELSMERPGTIDVPFAANYRINTPLPMLIDDVVRKPGEVFAVSGRVTIRPATGFEPDRPTAVRLSLASAHPPPPQEPPHEDIFVGL